MTSHHKLRLAVDIGGTFTDVVLAGAAGEILATTKTPTPPTNPTLGAMMGVASTLKSTGASIQDVTGFIHGTTLATNALIERRGARAVSIATIDRSGRLQVGPRSAGSEQGPAAFCKGGSEPTVTDADVVLGLIDPQLFAEGRLEIDFSAAENAIMPC